MKLAYVAGPYRDSRGEWFVMQNIRKAEAIAIELWKMGYAVITPQLNTRFFGGICDDSVWLAGDLEILKRCDLVVMVPGWEQSEGSQAEYRKASNLGIPVYFWERDQNALPPNP